MSATEPLKALESLGLDPKTIENRVVESIVATILDEQSFDRALDEKLRVAINAKVDEIAEEHVIPELAKRIDGIVLQRTNKWGEDRGESCTLIEYITQRGEDYLAEKVDYDGRSKGDRDRMTGWTGTQTRIAHLIDRHLHYAIETAMENALKIMKDGIATGLEETVRIKLGELKESLKIKVTTKRER